MTIDFGIMPIALSLMSLLLLQALTSSAFGYESPGNSENLELSAVSETIILGKEGWENGSPSGIAINNNMNLVYVANRNSDTVLVINASTNSVIDTISVGFGPVGIEVNHNTNFIYVTQSNVGTITVIDGATNKIVKTLEPDNSDEFYSHSGGISINEKTNRVYVLTNNSPKEGGQAYASITAIDGLTNNMEQSFKVADLRWDYDVGDSARDIAVNPETNTIYVVLMFGDLYVIDGASNTVSDKLTIGYEKTPHQIALNEETNTVYVSNFNNKSISVINGSTNEIIKTVRVGIDPQGIATDSATNTIYVVTLAGEVSVIDGMTFELKGKMPVGEFPERAAFNKNSGFLYVTNAGSNSVSVIDTRQVTDGSEWKTARIFIASEGFSNATIRYTLSSGAIETPYIDANGQRQVQSDVIVADIYFPSLTIPVNSSSPGTLLIELPRNIIDSKMNDNMTDSEFSPVIRTYPDTVLRPAVFEELNKTDTMRVLSIQYPARLSNDMSDQVEVIINGQLFIPEFSSSIAIIVMALSMGATTLILSRRYFQR